MEKLLESRVLRTDEASGNHWAPDWVELSALRLNKLLSGGSLDPEEGYRFLSKAVAEDCIEGLVGTLLKVLLQHGLKADTVGARHGWTVLHDCLWSRWPDAEMVLQLVKTSTPDLPDQRGNTALHLVIEGLVRQRYFQEHGKLSGAHGGGIKKEQDALEGTHDHFLWRADFAQRVFNQLMEAGFSASVENGAGFTPRDRLLTGLETVAQQKAAHLEELNELIDRFPKIDNTTEKLRRHVSEGNDVTLLTLIHT
eukprot:TRINITY_DN22056_c0_g2_i1.p1 TRINITY_DN22056_c0_g2~~TRINITY_DN22056_c0_g2_i1.p1  ORF type:complete len:253 (-),score=55.28 TRINITY_DN22056_c0_g2_i1:89-847(-)